MFLRSNGQIFIILEHIEQFVTTNKFQWFDYGPNNIYHYGSHSPPKYELSNVQVPVFLYHLETDNIISLIVRIFLR